AQAAQGAARLPFFDLVLAAIAVGIRHRVAAVAIGDALEQARLVLLAGLGDQLVGDAAHGEHVHAVDAFAGHIVGTRLLPYLGDGRGPVDRGAHAIEVVDADEDDRQVPELGHVQRFVKGSDVGRAVAKDAHHDFVGALIVDRIGAAAGDRERLEDDGVADIETLYHAGKVTR